MLYWTLKISTKTKTKFKKCIKKSSALPLAGSADGHKNVHLYVKGTVNCFFILGHKDNFHTTTMLS